MTWYVPSTYSLGQEAASSQTFCLDTHLSGLAKLSLTRETSCCNDNKTTSCPSSQSGTTLTPSMENPGEEQLTFFAEDSHARTFQAKGLTTEQSRELMESAVGYGNNTSELLAKCNLSTYLPKIVRTLELADLLPSSKTLPIWGMMQDGVVLEHIMSVRPTGEKDAGYLPTPVATDWKGGTTAIRKDKGKQRLDQWRDYVKVKYGMTYPHPTHSELLMGWPIGWTDLKPLEMAKFRQWQLLHGNFSPPIRTIKN